MLEGSLRISHRRPGAVCQARFSPAVGISRKPVSTAIRSERFPGGQHAHDDVENGAASGNVILTGGASACNIFWQVGSSAVLGGTTFFGNILALASVTLTSSTQFTGRALARTGAVTIATGTLVTNPGGQ